MNIFKNQEQIFLHGKLAGNDAAYDWSISNGSIINMQLVLKAHGEKHDWDTAELQVRVGRALTLAN